MNGHRRVSNELFQKHLVRGEYKEIVALLTIDQDHFLGGKKGLRAVAEYARVFGQSRSWVRTRIRHYLDSRPVVYPHSCAVGKDTLRTGTGQAQDRHGTSLLSQSLSPEPGARSQLETSELETEASTPRERAPWASLINILAKHPGTNEEKRDWMEEHWDLLQADTDKTNPPTDKARNATLKSLTIRYYRQHRGGGIRRIEPRSAGWRRAMEEAHAAGGPR